MPPQTASLLQGFLIVFAVVFVAGITIATAFRILEVKKDPTDALTWIFAAFMFPLLGSVAFFVMGDPIVRKTMRRLRQDHIRRRDLPNPKVEEYDGFFEFPQLLTRLGAFPSTFGNDIHVFSECIDTYRAMLRDLRKAEQEICFEFYTVRDDATGMVFLRELVRKAREGVRVYFLYDAMGSGSLKKRTLERLEREGIVVVPFMELNLFRKRIQINFRNHRKLLIIDRKVAYTGGTNIGDEHLGKNREVVDQDYWFDCQIRIEGPAVMQLLEEFAADWDFATDSGTKTEAIIRDANYPGRIFEGNDPKDTGWLQVIHSGPDQVINHTRYALFYAVTHARKRLWISTPYFAPDQALLAALVTSAMSGVDVRILTTNDKPDIMLSYWAGRYFWEPVLKAGGRIFQFQPGMLHAKLLLADEDLATVGSANLDIRSLGLNFELTTCFYSRRDIAEVEAIFERRIGESIEVGEEYLNRPWRTRLKENLARMFAPML
ncbi:MAG: cardiolipin synthase [Sumerlaeia bacterium]